MRRNRKRTKKMSVVASNTIHFGLVIVMLFIMVIVNLLASSSCQQLQKSLGEKERQIAKLEEERVRESARWEELKTPERLESALLKHGLAMRYPKPDQVIRMKANGKPYPGQLSVMKAGGDVAEMSYPNRRRSSYRKVR